MDNIRVVEEEEGSIELEEKTGEYSPGEGDLDIERILKEDEELLQLSHNSSTEFDDSETGSIGSTSQTSLVTSLAHSAAKRRKENADVVQQETPLPIKKLLVVLIALFSESFASTMLFSFVNFMVLDFGVEKEVVGYYVGWLASSFFLGQFVMSFYWGYFADRYGRRPTLFIGLSGTLISMLWFGLSSTYTSAILARLLGGLLNSNFAIGKAVMSDLTDSTNKARGFSYIGMMWGIGSIIGPFTGGMFSKPAQYFPSLQGGFFEVYPYFLPTCFGSFVCFLGLLGIIFFLPESLGTHSSTPPSTDVELQQIKQSKQIPEANSISKLLAMATDKIKGESNAEFKELADEEPVINSLKEETIENNEEFEEDATIKEILDSIHLSKTPAEKSRLRIMWEMLQDRTVQKACFLYSVLSIAFVTLDEVFILWVSAFPNRGGLGFKEVDIGIVWAISGISLMFFQLGVYPIITNAFGPVNVFKTGSLMSSLFITMMPFAHLGVYNNLKWPILAFIMIWRTWSGTMCFTSANIIVNDSAAPEHSGKVNGLAMSFAGFARAIGPAFGGIVYAWSSTVDSFPIDYHFVFFLLSAFCIICFIIALFLPKRMNHPK